MWHTHIRGHCHTFGEISIIATSFHGMGNVSMMLQLVAVAQPQNTTIAAKA
jgi:hypothetical protein